MYGSSSPDVTNVIFTNGNNDPWRVLSVLKDLNEHSPAILIDGTYVTSYPKRHFKAPEKYIWCNQISHRMIENFFFFNSFLFKWIVDRHFLKNCITKILLVIMEWKFHRWWKNISRFEWIEENEKKCAKKLIFNNSSIKNWKFLCVLHTRLKWNLTYMCNERSVLK